MEKCKEKENDMRIEMEKEEQEGVQWMRGDIRSAFMDNDRLGQTKKPQY